MPPRNSRIPAGYTGRKRRCGRENAERIESDFSINQDTGEFYGNCDHCMAFRKKMMLLEFRAYVKKRDEQKKKTKGKAKKAAAGEEEEGEEEEEEEEEDEEEDEQEGEGGGGDNNKPRVERRRRRWTGEWDWEGNKIWED